ncbi:MAG TPA: sulfatase-like hydrolase/transferase [Gammaproteobacteria bacterium]
MNRVTLLICSLLVCAAAHAQPVRPNILFIMTDDAGYGDFGSYGAPDVRTPVLDQLARDGVRFTSFYSNGPTCSPTRAGFLSGRYQQRYNVEAPLPTAPRAQGRGLTAEGHSLPQLLKTAGYRTALIGKWHLGYEADQSPGAHGFDYFFGFKAGFVDYYQHTNSDGELDLWEQDRTVEEEGYLTDLITARAVRYIEERSSEPFFLSVQYNAPHWPYQPPGKPSVAARNAAHLQVWEEGAGTRADYVAMLEHVDQGIGQILNALENAGIAEDTLVIFTNDNGGEWLSRNAPLTNRKFSVWEGGIRVPAIMRWPGVIPAGRVTDQVGITMDFTATILAVAGAKLPEGYTPDGIDLLPIVTGDAEPVERTLFWRAGNASAVRSGDLKLIQQGPQTFFVFNVREDPAERNDLTRTSQTDARRLYQLLQEWHEEMDAEGAQRRPETETP